MVHLPVVDQALSTTHTTNIKNKLHNSNGNGSNNNNNSKVKRTGTTRALMKWSRVSMTTPEGSP